MQYIIILFIYYFTYIYIFNSLAQVPPNWCFSACAFDAPHRTWHGTWKRFAPGEKQSLRPQEQFQAVCAPCVAADGESVHSTFALDTFWANAVLFNVVLLCAAYYSDCFPHLIFIDKYSRLHAVFWRFQAFHGLRQKCMAVCPGTSCESLSAKCCAKAWSIGGRLDRGRNFFTDFTMISHSPNFSWWLGKPWADASYNMMYCYVSCCCSCSFLGQCGMSIVCRWISGVTTRPISLHLLVPILVPPGMHWSSPMVIPCSTLLAHTCPISSPNPSHTAIGIMGKSHCSLMFTVHHSRLPREENRWHFIYIHILYIHFCCKYM